MNVPTSPERLTPAYSDLTDSARKWQEITRLLNLPITANVLAVIDAAVDMYGYAKQVEQFTTPRPSIKYTGTFHACPKDIASEDKS